MASINKDPVSRFAGDVLEGKVVAGPSVRGACQRHFDDLRAAKDKGIIFDFERANHALDFFPQILRLNGGQFENQPFILAPAQEFIVGSLFGWVRDEETYPRRFRVSYIEMGKGNGKSPLAGGIGLYGLAADKEARAEIYAAATKKDQAMILFRDAVAMVLQSEPLSRNMRLSGKDDKVWNIYYPRTGGFFKPISADDGQSGPRPHMGLVDELHEHRNGAVLNLMSAGRKWRRQPLIFCITNSGTDKTSICWEYHEAAVNVARGAKLDDTMFSYVCDLDEKDDPFTDESCWKKANPLLDVILTRQYLRDEVNQAVGMPSKRSVVKRLNFCIWTEAESPMFDLELWDACGADFTLDIFSGQTVYVGLDLSKSQDLTCAMIVCRTKGKFFWYPLFWLPGEGIRRKSEKDKVPYDYWAEKGHILLSPGTTIEKSWVVAELVKLSKKYKFKIGKIVYDRWRIDDFKKAAKEQNVVFEYEEFGQGFKDMAPAIDKVEEDMSTGLIVHNKNPCLRWNIANTVATQDPAGNRKYDKSKATGRIDGTVAGTMGHHRLAISPAPATPRVIWSDD